MKYLRAIHVPRAFKWCLAGAFALALAACGSGDDFPAPSNITTTVSAASLSGEQEVPPTSSGALGTGTLSLVALSRAISGSITLDGITATAAHIHIGDAGVSGPIIVPLTETAPNTWSVPAGATLTEAQATAFAAGGLYYNAHSVANPNGEIRGQIGREVFAAQLTSAQEVPATPSTATGNGLLSLDPASKKFSARITLTGIAATAAHIHTGTIGNNGAIIFPLTQTAPASGVWVSAADATLTDSQLAELKAGGLYFNAH
ncbi:MAG: CHRD domain-containing protein, partial [Polaromonas sp.]